jgi:hypothetical protein
VELNQRKCFFSFWCFVIDIGVVDLAFVVMVGAVVVWTL